MTWTDALIIAVTLVCVGVAWLVAGWLTRKTRKP